MSIATHEDDTAVVTVREWRPGDETGILDLFRRVFGVERSVEHWRWKFLDNPAGREVLVAVDRDGRIAGQFAALPNRARIEGRDAMLSQLLDHMVDPALHRRGAYATMARAFHRRFVATAPGTTWYGFNLEEIHRIQRGLYDMQAVAPVETWSLSSTAQAGTGGACHASRSLAARFHDALVAVERVERFPAEVDGLWARARVRYPVAVERDARYLGWRYADCPDVDYALLLARHRATQHPLGLLVLRPGWPHDSLAAVVDWVVPPSSTANAAWRALLDRARAIARESGLPVLRAWLPATSPDREILARRGFATGASPFLTSLWEDGETRRPNAAVRRAWHYTMGDTDIF